MFKNNFRLCQASITLSLIDYSDKQMVEFLNKNL